MFARIERGSSSSSSGSVLIFEGAQVPFQPGDSVAAALLAAGASSFREGPVDESPPAPYCMMGVCFECLVETDGRQNQQSCLTKARHGLDEGRALRRHGVKIHRRVSDLRIEGIERATSVGFQTGTRTRRIDLDLIALHEGVIPNQQIARSIGCDHRWDQGQQCFFPVLDPMGESSIPGIFIAGDGGGIIGAAACAHAGTLCALAILDRLGKIEDTEFASRKIAARRAYDAHLATRPFLDRLYRPRDEVLVPADEAAACRCEAVRSGSIRQVIRQGCLGPNQTKAFLRSGMGPCQGRMCGPTASAIIARETGQGMDETGYYRVRAPLKPITVGELAGQYGDA